MTCPKDHLIAGWARVTLQREEDIRELLKNIKYFFKQYQKVFLVYHPLLYPPPPLRGGLSSLPLAPPGGGVKVREGGRFLVSLKEILILHLCKSPKIISPSPKGNFSTAGGAGG